MRLKEKVAIITGGGSGIGRGIALMFAKEGAKVVVVGRRREPLEETANLISALPKTLAFTPGMKTRSGNKLEVAVEETRKSGGFSVADVNLPEQTPPFKAGKFIKQNQGEVLVVQADVSDSNQVSSLIEKTVGQFSQLDILVNNAGVALTRDAILTTEEEWNKTIAIDLKGVWLCAKAVIPQMLKQGKGKIINIASIAGLVGFEQSAAYCAAKGGVVNLTRAMALDYASRQINVNAIAPGIIETDMTKPFLTEEKMRLDFLIKTPIGRIGKPEDIAYAALYLASNESDFVTGQTLVVDGGWTIK